MYYKVRHVLQSVTHCHCKVRQVLQSAAIITKWRVTMAPVFFNLNQWFYFKNGVFKMNFDQADSVFFQVFIIPGST